MAVTPMPLLQPVEDEGLIVFMHRQLHAAGAALAIQCKQLELTGQASGFVQACRGSGQIALGQV
ncbi:hypothetical protein D3C81_2137910 [compost metagenome]